MDENSENFDELKRLLAVKKHETPPPGFHGELRGLILAQITEEEQAGAAGWWGRFVESFELRPAISTGYAAALCGLLVAGVFFGIQSGHDGGDQPSLASDGIPGGEIEVHNPFVATNHSLTSPPPGLFEPQLGSGLQHVSKTNVSEPRR
jgi:hypothetical protein